MVTLICSVRNCRLPLVREERRFVCGRNHSFDIARSGYVNLLQPQERRSRNPGDSSDAVAARRRLLERGIGAQFVAPMTRLLHVGRDAALLDAGCGEGFYLEAFRAAIRCESHGTDISTPAIDLAARRYPECHFVVANADRFLPYADASFAAVTSITARVNASEFARVLATDGQLLLAVAGPDDLIELRGAVLGEAKEIDRTEREVGGFELQQRERVTHKVRLDRAAISDIMASTYRGMRSSQRERMEALPDEMDVTLSRDLLLYSNLTLRT